MVNTPIAYRHLGLCLSLQEYFYFKRVQIAVRHEVHFLLKNG